MDIKSREARSANMSHIRSRDTAPELYVRRLLFSEGFRYRVYPKDVTGHPDIWFPGRKVAAFVHGCYWHRHQGCSYSYSPSSNIEFWEKKFAANVFRDETVRSELNAQGIRCIVIWECTVKRMKKDTELKDRVVQCIREFMISDDLFLEI